MGDVRIIKNIEDVPELREKLIYISESKSYKYV